MRLEYSETPSTPAAEIHHPYLRRTLGLIVALLALNVGVSIVVAVCLSILTFGVPLEDPGAADAWRQWEEQAQRTNHQLDELQRQLDAQDELLGRERTLLRRREKAAERYDKLLELLEAAASDN